MEMETVSTIIRNIKLHILTNGHVKIDNDYLVMYENFKKYCNAIRLDRSDNLFMDFTYKGGFAIRYLIKDDEVIMNIPSIYRFLKEDLHYLLDNYRDDCLEILEFVFRNKDVYINI